MDRCTAPALVTPTSPARPSQERTIRAGPGFWSQLRPPSRDSIRLSGPAATIWPASAGSTAKPVKGSAARVSQVRLSADTMNRPLLAVSVGADRLPSGGMRRRCRRRGPPPRSSSGDGDGDLHPSGIVAGAAGGAGVVVVAARAVGSEEEGGRGEGHRDEPSGPQSMILSGPSLVEGRGAQVEAAEELGVGGDDDGGHAHQDGADGRGRVKPAQARAPPARGMATML